MTEFQSQLQSRLLDLLNSVNPFSVKPARLPMIFAALFSTKSFALS